MAMMSYYFKSGGDMTGNGIKGEDGNRFSQTEGREIAATATAQLDMVELQGPAIPQRILDLSQQEADAKIALEFISTLYPPYGTSPTISSILQGLENLNSVPDIIHTVILNAIPSALEDASTKSNYIEDVAKLLGALDQSKFEFSRDAVLDHVNSTAQLISSCGPFFKSLLGELFLKDDSPLKLDLNSSSSRYLAIQCLASVKEVLDMRSRTVDRQETIGGLQTEISDLTADLISWLPGLIKAANVIKSAEKNLSDDEKVLTKTLQDTAGAVVNSLCTLAEKAVHSSDTKVTKNITRFVAEVIPDTNLSGGQAIAQLIRDSALSSNQAYSAAKPPNRAAGLLHSIPRNVNQMSDNILALELHFSRSPENLNYKSLGSAITLTREALGIAAPTDKWLSRFCYSPKEVHPYRNGIHGAGDLLLWGVWTVPNLALSATWFLCRAGQKWLGMPLPNPLASDFTSLLPTGLDIQPLANKLFGSSQSK
jgi:hypothetical protein